MMRSTLIAMALGALALFCAPVPSFAGDSTGGRELSKDIHQVRYYRSYRRGTRVHGYVARRGGYSYIYEDSINTYGDSRSKYGSASSLRDPALDRQTLSGPFDHGFFFDSGVAPRGGDSPYLH